MKVKYTGALADYSGYGEAGRHDVGALHAAGVVLTTEIPKYTIELSDFGKLGSIARDAENRQLGYKIKILHVTPNVYQKYLEAGKYHVGRVFWETNKLPLAFASKCEILDEIWTGSQYNADAIRAAGVTKPIHIITEAIDANAPEPKPYLIPNQNDFKFYAIFEWTERKNPMALLEAFWREFEGTKGVSLTIKTYVDNFQPSKFDEIKSFIKKAKRRVDVKAYPPVYLFTQLMDRRQMYRFHATFDCYVSPHRGEGWGIPQMEALLMANPVISTNCGGIHEYLEHKKTAYLLPYSLCPVKNSRNDAWYTLDQRWADVKVDDIRKGMRWVFENQKQAREMGLEGQKVVKSKFSFEFVGGKMLERLKKISKKLEPHI
jgi:glycosyltransferase involved in cell wall biosynthesis